MTCFLRFLTDEQLFDIFETVVRAVLTTNDSSALSREEHDIVSVLSSRGHTAELLVRHKRICEEVFAAWQAQTVVPHA